MAKSLTECKNLAEYLGLPTVAEEMGADPQETKPEEQPEENFNAQSFAKTILNSADYRRSLYYRIRLHELPPAVESLLYHYAFGKPIDKLEVKDKTNPLESVSLDTLKQRVAFLQNVIEQLEPGERPENETFVTKTIH